MNSNDNHNKVVARKNVTMACIACRNKKCKCDGHTPCSSCRSVGNRCMYDHNDRRRYQRQPHAGGVSRPNHADAQQVGNASMSADTSTLKAKHSTTSGVGIPLAPITSQAWGRTQDKPLKMEKMQGKFRVVTNTSGPRAGAGNLQLRPKSIQDRSGNDDQVPDQTRQNSTVLTRQDKLWPYSTPGYTRTFGNLPFSSSITANGYPAAVQTRQRLNFTTSQHLVFPLADQDDSPLGLALTDFLRLAGRLLADGVPAIQVVDPGLVDVTLFFRDRLPEDCTTVSMWTAEMLRAFRGTFPDDLLLACAACVARLVNWYLIPTLENYANMPLMMRPTSLQRLRPHPPWMDLMMFPSFRDALVHRSREWVEPCMKAQWSVLWPYPTEKALIRLDTGQVFLAPDFTAHIGDFKHWSMQSNILETFPEVESSEINILRDENHATDVGGG